MKTTFIVGSMDGTAAIKQFITDTQTVIGRWQDRAKQQQIGAGVKDSARYAGEISAYTAVISFLREIEVAQ